MSKRKENSSRENSRPKASKSDADINESGIENLQDIRKRARDDLLQKIIDQLQPATTAPRCAVPLMFELCLTTNRHRDELDVYYQKTLFKIVIESLWCTKRRAAGVIDPSEFTLLDACDMRDIDKTRLWSPQEIFGCDPEIGRAHV